MELVYPEQPETGPALVGESFGEFIESPEAAAEVLGESVDRSDLRLTPAHRRYTVAIDEVRARNLTLDEDRPVGWRYLVVSRDVVVAAVDLDIGERRDELEVAGIWRGPIVDETVRAIELLERLEQPEGYAQPLELRTLELPPIYFAALWVHAPRSDATRADLDLFVPLGGMTAGLEADRAHEVDRVVGMLAAQAERVVNSGPAEPSG